MSRNLEAISICNSDLSIQSFPSYYAKKNCRRRSSLLKRRCGLLRRLVRKSGRASVYQKGSPSKCYRYLRDISNTLINSHWNWTLLVLSSAFVFTWLIFACLWMIISKENGDNDESNKEPCLTGVQGFAGYLLFSIETQSSIGYGTRYINHYCPEAIFLMCVQIGTGVCICGSLVCIVYAKMIGPNRLHSMDCFSKHAVINLREGVLSLMFRIRDTHGRYGRLTKVTAYLVQKRKEQVCLKSIKLDPVGILIWPVEVVHRINETSPFWDLSARDLIIKRFEIVVEMEGTSATTSLASKMITSYLNREILWGHRFKPCVVYDITERAYYVNQKLFNKTDEVITPLCSAKRLYEVYSDVTSSSTYPSDTSSPLFCTNKSYNQNGYESLSSGTLSPVIVHASSDDKKGTNNKLLDSESSYSTSSSSEEEDEYTCEGLCTMDMSGDELYKSLEKFVIDENRKKSNKNKFIHYRHHRYNETAF